jgi:type IV fimbrial biogenesis protein FimT
VLISPKSLAGVTLIELMIAIAIIGILLLAGLPEASRWIQNTRIRTAAESISNGLQLARGEAVRRNAPVAFVLTSNAPTAVNVGTAPNNSGPNWLVRVFDSTGLYNPNPPTIPTQADYFIQGAAETGANVSISLVPPSVPNIVFTGLGRATADGINPLPAVPNTIQVTNPTGGACVAAAGPMHCLNVVVQPGGQIRMCDPNPAILAGDTRKC